MKLLNEMHMPNPTLSNDDQVPLAKGIAEIVGLAALDLISTMQPLLDQSNRARGILFLNIVESLNACNILVRAGLDIHGALHVRSMLESLVNMTLLKSPGHLRQMYYDKIAGELKICTKLLEDPYLSSESVAYLHEEIKKLNPDITSLKTEGFRKKIVANLISDAKLPFLTIPYVMLNSMAHWDLSVLLERYEKKGGGLQVFSNTRPAITFGIMWIAIQIMVVATDAVREAAKFADGSYEREFNKMNNAWSILLQEQDKNAS